ncbi:MAG TPA: DUF167 domain-containing protein [Candidatus Paceibacterota bacterium]
MRISVTVRAGSGEEKVEELANNSFKVWVREAPQKGLANKALIHALAKHFGTSQSNVRIVSGHTSRNKIVTIG